MSYKYFFYSFLLVLVKTDPNSKTSFFKMTFSRSEKNKHSFLLVRECTFKSRTPIATTTARKLPVALRNLSSDERGEDVEDEEEENN